MWSSCIEFWLNRWAKIYCTPFSLTTYKSMPLPLMVTTNIFIIGLLEFDIWIGLPHLKLGVFV